MTSSDYLHNLFNLENKTAVVIGGTGELCGKMAEGLAGAGATVFLAGRSQEKADNRIAACREAGLPGQVKFIPSEVTNRADLESLRDAVLAETGQIDIVINGAGVNSATPFLDITEEEYQRIMDINVRGLFQSCQVFGSYLVARGQGGSIINLGSMSGLLPLSRVFTYSLSKAAVHNLTKNLAREWATHRVRVNTLVPGFFPAEQNKKVLTPERVGQIMGHTPAKRFGEARELIGATLLLASETAGSFLTGLELVVDGGFSSQTI